MANPLDELKRLWRDPKKRPWLLAGAGATGAAAIYTLRRPTSIEDATAESHAAEQPAALTPIDASLDPATTGPGSGYYALPVIPSSGLIGGDSYGSGGGGMEEMDFSPFWDALEEQGTLAEETIAAAVAASQLETSEQIAATKAEVAAKTQKQQQQIGKVKTKVTKVKEKNQKQQEQIKAQREKNQKQQQQIRRLRQRAKKGPKPKPKRSSQPARRERPRAVRRRERPRAVRRRASNRRRVARKRANR